MSDERMQWIFTHGCGCPVGVLEGSAAQTRSKALREMYDGVGGANRAVDRGVQVQLITHRVYVSEYLEKMKAPGRLCPHD